MNWVFMDNVRDLLSSHELNKISPLSAPDLCLLIDRLQIHSLHIKFKVHDYILSDHPINVEICEAVANRVTYWCGCVDASRYPHDSIQPTASHFNSEAQNAPEMNPYTSLYHPNSPSSMATETFCREITIVKFFAGAAAGGEEKMVRRRISGMEEDGEAAGGEEKMRGFFTFFGYRE
ncbi:hypothetical protein Vadar_004848 [Vaccinium darrowii]|uniref:Uncharacterized protein n=1 Tax=Vaccinium darrowii TaxID=229202 RepID=A0ACB7YT21_9ERIC|nr:hypothetical protein Vadar_004848 [Vaccinium darrowii]